MLSSFDALAQRERGMTGKIREYYAATRFLLISVMFFFSITVESFNIFRLDLYLTCLDV